MTFDKYFDLVTAEWFVSEKAEHGISAHRVIVVRKNDGVTISKNGLQVLFLPIEQWEELKRRI